MYDPMTVADQVNAAAPVAEGLAGHWAMRCALADGRSTAQR